MAGVIVGKHMLYDVSLTVNAVNLSDHVEHIELTLQTNAGRGDAMGDLQQYDMALLLMIPDVKVTFYQDFNTAKVYATLYAAWATPQTYFNVVAKASSAANATTNPQWTIPCFVKTAPVMLGTHGDRHMAAVTFGVSGAYSVATS